MRDTLQLLSICAERLENSYAVVDEEQSVTYGEFFDRVALLSGAIANTDVAHPKVLLNLPQGIDAYAAMFATHMAGGYYCPLNIGHPTNRKHLISNIFEPDIVLSRSSLEGEFLAEIPHHRILYIDNHIDATRLEKPKTAHELAYVMFTSGSSGEPKGVMVGRNALSHYAAWAGRTMKVTPEDRWSQHPNIGFDLSVLDIYGALCHCACLFPVKGIKGRLIPAEAIKAFRMTIWNSVPSVLDVMAKRNQLTSSYLESLRLMTFCGEPLLREHLEQIFSARPDISVHNTYGPTEATVSCTLQIISSKNWKDICRKNVSFGRPIGGMEFKLEGGRTETEGELIISGPQVAHGYWKRPELTHATFTGTTDELVCARSYRTGDWVEIIENNYYFVQRVDRQIKRRGHRIELGDIDAAIRRFTNSATCTVFVEDQLVSFAEDYDSGLEQRLRKWLSEYLPEYCLPDAIHPIDALPKNANDKVDVPRLQEIVLENNMGAAP